MKSFMGNKKIINVSSGNQSGGVTSGEINKETNINLNIWKERSKGGFLVLALELIIYIIKIYLNK